MAAFFSMMAAHRMMAPPARMMVAPVSPQPGPVRVWDGVFDSSLLQTVVDAGEQRGHCFTTVFDRGPKVDRPGRTVIESVLTSLLQSLGDESRYVEYWWRGESNGMEVHRDVDECATRA